MLDCDKQVYMPDFARKSHALPFKAGPVEHYIAYGSMTISVQNNYF